MSIHWRIVYAANSCAYCILRSSTVSIVMAITEAEEGGGVRENVKYDDDVIRSLAPVYLNRFFCMKISSLWDGEDKGEGGFTGGALPSTQISTSSLFPFSAPRRDDVWF